MRSSKAAGGLGFRDLEFFNMALLAKQSWRLLQYPNSLAAKLLSTKYYPHGNFMQAQIKRTTSFIWRSILLAKPLSEAGLLWCIGNGRQTCIWKNKWLPGPSPHMILRPIKDSDSEVVVASPIDQSSMTWKLDALKSLFSKE
ncbi:hypothetical protein F2P56_027124 [Juglans regia]|uniref:Uncharacterized protein n=2 Tax=Juglans regia TaxID=51240 RepID=A0A833TPS3_JUGRE|nr:uncharacterized mitochondrial protein AtMg00310-like [Juglans regia]KAF5452090.1 hypothetical protein F2P56_027124 [Juglans regia]